MSYPLQDEKIKDLIARLVRAKLVRKNSKGLEDILTEALCTPARYKFKEKQEIKYFYYLTVGGKVFRVLYDEVRDNIKIYGPLEKGQTFDQEKEKLFLVLPYSILEHYKEE